MTKTEFLAALRDGLAALPLQDRERSLEYYSEMFDDRLEEGLGEAEVIASLGSPAEIAVQILAETPTPVPDTPRENSRRGMRAWEIILLILGAPLWISLIAAAVSIVLSVFVVLWSAVLVFYSAAVCCAAGALVALVAAVLGFWFGNPLAALFLAGAGFVSAGLAVIVFLFSHLAAKGAWMVCRWTVRGIIACFIRKEDSQ